MRVETFRVRPALPQPLEGLRTLAYNFLWRWDEQVRAVFNRVDRELWDRTQQNPVLLLGSLPQERLEELARDDGFMAFFRRVYEHYESYLQEPTWWDRHHGERPRIAYFSAEFGIAECLPIYSGGLGVLAAHHLKSASDLGVPLVGVGLLYQQGYFRQYLTSDGWQQESYPVNDFYNLPIERVLKGGEPLTILMELAGRPLVVQVWKAQVGRVPLYLLDTNLPENPRDLQDITDQLYGGDQENRLRQELVLGVGGLRALEALDLHPDVCHMNEGHSAFLSLERVRLLMEKHDARFGEALEVARAGAVFTTHTPVPAGFDAFTPQLMEQYFSGYCDQVGISFGELLALGRPDGAEPEASFNMAALALRTSASANGVSELHGEVSRRLLGAYTPSIPAEEVPIGHVTNGAHTRTCVSREMAGLFDRYLGPEWWRRPGAPETWKGVDNIPDEELWATHERRRERLVAFARRRLTHQLEERGASKSLIERARGVLSGHALTIGFARRFATYKRATLILRDLERLKKLILDSSRPVQIIFAGKAHPKDSEGKETLKAIVQFCSSDDVRRHAVFVEDYDLVVARHLVQGVDVWLNTPRRGMEASGTSGMKVLPNGGLNLSVLDGWWCEGYSAGVGWAIGRGEDYEDHEYQDFVESNALYDILENDVVPLFYERAVDGLPRGWIAMMKRSIKELTPRFSSNRMVSEYSDRYYVPAARSAASLGRDELARARALAKWKERVSGGWSGVRIESVERRSDDDHRFGDTLGVEARVRVDGLALEDLRVEVLYGALNESRRLIEPRALLMAHVGPDGPSIQRFTGSIPCDRSGMMGYAVRVRPLHADDPNALSTGLMTWA